MAENDVKKEEKPAKAPELTFEQIEKMRKELFKKQKAQASVVTGDIVKLDNA
jgi:hypothetical protein